RELIKASHTTVAAVRASPSGQTGQKEKFRFASDGRRYHVSGRINEETCTAVAEMLKTGATDSQVMPGSVSALHSFAFPSSAARPSCRLRRAPPSASGGGGAIVSTDVIAARAGRLLPARGPIIDRASGSLKLVRLPLERVLPTPFLGLIQNG